MGTLTLRAMVSITARRPIEETSASLLRSARGVGTLRRPWKMFVGQGGTTHPCDRTGKDWQPWTRRRAWIPISDWTLVLFSAVSPSLSCCFGVIGGGNHL